MPFKRSAGGRVATESCFLDHRVVALVALLEAAAHDALGPRVIGHVAVEDLLP
jgi:hypothetical protein